MKKTWSRKKITDEFSGMLKADGTPMSRQQIHMLRKKARGICMICSEPAVGVYCLKHTIAVRERMRKKLKFRRRLLKSASYVAQNSAKAAAKSKSTKIAKTAKSIKAVKAVKAVKSFKAVKAIKAAKAPAKRGAKKGKR
jgi:hypothetical protein